MTSKVMMMLAAGAFVAAAAVGPSQARSFTTTPEATMHEQQKLGPNSVTTQLQSGFVTERIGAPRTGMYGPVYGYAPRYAPGPGYAWDSGYHHGYGDRWSHGYGPGFGLSVGIY